MDYVDFRRDKRLLEAAEIYKSKFGGHFGGGVPDGELMYETSDGEVACTPPYEATVDQVLQDLQSGKPLSELWPKVEYDPNCDY